MNQRNITKYQLRKARRLLRLGFFVKSLKKYNSILEEEINSPLKNFKIGILNGNLSRFDDALHFFEENYFFNFWLNLRKLLFKNSELLLCLRKFKANLKAVKSKLVLKANMSIMPKRPSLDNVTLIIIDCLDFYKANISYLHCTNSLQFAKSKILTHFQREEPYVENIPKISSSIEYSRFCIKELTNYFDTEFVMIAQWDGFVWQPDLWDPKFLHYDYIGAPWGNIVGNGGFSIRSKRLHNFLREDSYLPDIYVPEDRYISQDNRPYLESVGFNFAPTEIARAFSLEDGSFRNSFGVHNRLELKKI